MKMRDKKSERKIEVDTERGGERENHRKSGDGGKNCHRNRGQGKNLKKRLLFAIVTQANVR